jgi:hypothetical protein
MEILQSRNQQNQYRNPDCVYHKFSKLGFVLYHRWQSIENRFILLPLGPSKIKNLTSTWT